VLKAIGLDDASDVSRVIQQAAAAFFSQEHCEVKDCVRLAQIAATLEASVPDEFQFVTQSGRRTAAKQHVLTDLEGDLDAFVDENWYAAHILHEDYSRPVTSCTESDWKHWISSGRGRLFGFIPLVRST